VSAGPESEKTHRGDPSAFSATTAAPRGCALCSPSREDRACERMARERFTTGQFTEQRRLPAWLSHVGDESSGDV
jgi:hypothetical protein